MELDVTEIQKIIPHRYLMLLIDKVIDLDPGKKATAIRNVIAHEEVINGHFPGNPVMPGLLIVEALAQAGAVALLSMDEFKGKTAYFGGIKKARFHKMVKSGDSLRLKVELTKLREHIGSGKGTAYVDGQKV